MQPTLTAAAIFERLPKPCPSKGHGRKHYFCIIGFDYFFKGRLHIIYTAVSTKCGFAGCY